MKIQNKFTKLVPCDLPIIAAPMFIVTSPDLVVATSESGGVGTIPTLNFRSTPLLDEGLGEIQSKTKKSYGVNLIVHKSNNRWREDLEVCAQHKVPFFITSLGSPKEVIEKVKGYGGIVFCDVTNTKHAQKVLDHGADGIIAVCAGAGGHSGPHSPFSLISELRDMTDKPIVAAGAIANGASILSALALGASAVSVGTRFIASHEALASEAYKQAIINAKTEDIQKSQKLTGIPASVIRTPELSKLFQSSSTIEKLIFIIESKNQGKTKFSKWLRKTFNYDWNWKNVWSAGESVGQIQNIKPVQEIMNDLAQEMKQHLDELNAIFAAQ
jgi:nitronate monooxygenase